MCNLKPCFWFYLTGLVLFIPIPIFAQQSNESFVDSVYAHYVESRLNDPKADLEELNDLEAHLTYLNDTCRLARVLSWKSNCYDKLGLLDSSIYFGHSALRLFNANCDSLILMSINSILTSSYLSLGDNEKVIAIADRNLELWNPDWPESSSRKAFQINRAIALVYRGEIQMALEAFKEMLKAARKSKNMADQMDACNNISAVYGVLHEQGGELTNLDSALKYVNMAIQMGKKLGKTEDVVIHYTNLSAIFQDKGNYAECHSYLDSAEFLAREGGYLQLLTKSSLVRSNTFAKMGNLDSALHHMRRYVSLKDSILGLEKVRAISEMQEKYQSEKKERQIKELEVEQLNAELREEQLTRTQNIYLFSSLGVFLLAVGLFGRLRYVRKARRAIQKEKDISEGLLLNILPEEVANELKEKGEAEAQLIEEVTVLFTDFKGFTALSEKVTPKQLVKDLHECFSAFDAICGKYGIEKIKTIGDAYMAAGGLPIPSADHAKKVVQAALEMRDFVEAGKARKIEQGAPFFEIRIGVHTGPVVAGIVGVKKFQYDIWGDTVNTASRMESSGEVGQVNISEATFDLVKEIQEFSFTTRGKVEAKGKGDLEMFFVSRSRN